MLVQSRDNPTGFSLLVFLSFILLIQGTMRLCVSEAIALQCAETTPHAFACQEGRRGRRRRRKTDPPPQPHLINPVRVPSFGGRTGRSP